jgi:transposase
MERKAYPSDGSDDAWALVVPSLTLMTEGAPQREHSLRAVLRLAQGRRAEPSAAICESRTLQSTPTSGTRAGDDGTKRRRGAKVHRAVETLGHLWALPGTAADAQARSQVTTLAATVHEVTGGDAVEVTFVDQGYTGAQAAEDAQAQPRRLAVVKLPETKKGVVLLPRRWVVERSNARAARLRRLARDDARWTETLAGWHCVACAILRLKRFVELIV